MLVWLDILIGLIVILLAVSLIVMILNQITIALLNLRGNNLKKGIQTLLDNLGVDLKQYSEEITTAVLSHPLISDKQKWLGWWKYATAIRKDELIKILEIISQTGDDAWKLKLRESWIDIKHRIDDWFDNAMDRVTQIFMRHTRISTIIFSIIIAFTFHLDFFNLFQQVSTDPELRASLVASSNAILNQAEDVIGTSNISAQIFTQSISELKQETAKGIADKIGNPPPLNSLKDGEDWLRGQLAGNEHIDSLIIKYRELSNKKLSESIDDMMKNAILIKKDLDSTKVQLIPRSYSKYSLGERHLWGVLIMAAFLSLGAPFWFKALKTLSALRPILATKDDQEKKEREQDKKN